MGLTTPSPPGWEIGWRLVEDLCFVRCGMHGDAGTRCCGEGNAATAAAATVIGMM
jgi:hypothetical protein